MTSGLSWQKYSYSAKLATMSVLSLEKSRNKMQICQDRKESQRMSTFFFSAFDINAIWVEKYNPLSVE